MGAYVVFVRRREQVESLLGYRLASFVAALRTLRNLRTFDVELEVEGKRRTYRTPLVFVGVHERELGIPMLGGRIANGRRGLHVIIPRADTRFGLALVALRSMLRGVQSVASTPRLDSFVVREARVLLRRVHGNVAVDGELFPTRAPLEYRLEAGGLRVVAPPPVPDASE